MKEEKGCLLLVDDEIRITRALKDFFKSNNYNVIEARDGQEALDMFYKNNNKIDLILLDVMMPKKNGYEVLKEIRENFLVPIIMLTAKGEEYDQLIGFNNGADDYIAKPFFPSLLLARVESVLKRVGKDKTQVTYIGALTLDTLRRQVKCNSENIELTLKEYDLLFYFILNKDLPLTREQILNSVWGYDYIGDTRTVDTHVKQLRAKLGDCSKYIKTVHRVGYRFEVQQ